MIHRGSMISNGTKIFYEKFLGPLTRILTCQKLICEMLYPNPPLIHILYVCFPLIDVHYIFLRRFRPIGNTRITMQFMQEYFSWELCETRIKICQILLKMLSNSVRNCVKFFFKWVKFSRKMFEIFWKTEWNFLKNEWNFL